MKTDEFRHYGYKIIDWLADYFDNVGRMRVVPDVKPGEIRAMLPDSAPFEPESMDEILKDFESKILPGVTHWQHPGWFAYFPANNSPASVLGELLTAGLGVQGMVWKTSPSAEELEIAVLDWLREMLGLPPEMKGVIQDTASTSTLCALITAREKATGFKFNERGAIRGLTVYASEESHSSVEKGVKIAGYGRINLRTIPTDDRLAMIPGELEAAIEKDKNAGMVPAFAVATAGTTSSGAIDPIRAIGEVCRRHSVWLHVDAAYGGTAAILPEKRWILDGVELVDSFVFNPHKWMLTNFDCSVYFVRDAAALVRTFEIHPEYLKTGVDAVVRNYRDWGIQLGRRFRALKLWFVIRSYGVSGIQAMVKEHLRLALLFKEWLAADGRFELMAPVDLAVVCFRLNDGRPESELNDLNERFHAEINSSGSIFLTHTALKGKYTIRLVVGQRTTTEDHVRQAWDIIRRAAENTAKIYPA